MSEIERIAKAMHRCQYREEDEAIPSDIKGGIVIAYGASDDLLEMRGAIRDEWGAWEGTELHVDVEGVIEPPIDEPVDYCRLKAAKHTIRAKWCPVDKVGKVFASWEISGTMPYAPFDVYENDELYCRGMVFYLGDVK